MQNINTEDEAREFIEGKFNDEAYFYLEGMSNDSQTSSDIKHVIKCLHSIVAHLFKLAPSGSFGQAIIRNDLRDAVCLADDTNRNCLYLYIMFLANKVPAKRLWDARKALLGSKS